MFIITMEFVDESFSGDELGCEIVCFQFSAVFIVIGVGVGRFGILCVNSRNIFKQISITQHHVYIQHIFF